MSTAEILKKLHEIIGLNKFDRPLRRDDQSGGAEFWKEKGLGKDFINLYIDDEKEQALANFKKKKWNPDIQGGAGSRRGAVWQIEQLVKGYKSAKGVTDQQAKKAIQSMLYAYASVDGDYEKIAQYADAIDKSATDMITGDNLNKPIMDIIRGRKSFILGDKGGKSSYTHTDTDFRPETPATPATPATPGTPEGEVSRFQQKRDQSQAAAPSILGGENVYSSTPLGTTDLGGDPFGMDLSAQERAYSGLTTGEIAAGLPLSALGGASPYARRTYQNLLNPLAQDNGVFSFLSTAGLTPRVALPGQPDVTNEALSFRAFLAQGPQSMATQINQGLSQLEEAKRLASEDNQRFYSDPTYATDIQKTLYTQFVDNPGNELALRQSLARRSYPGQLGDVIAETLAKSYFATLATDPYGLTQPGFYKNAFREYLPDTVANNFLPGSASANKKAVAAAVDKIADDDTNKEQPKASEPITKESVLPPTSGDPGATDMPDAGAFGKFKKPDAPMPWDDPMKEDFPVDPTTTTPTIPGMADIGGDPFDALRDIDETSRAAVPEGAIRAEDGSFIDPATYNMDPQAFQQFQQQQREGLTPRLDAQGNIIGYDRLPEGQRVITDPVTGQTRIAPALPVSDAPPSPPGMDPNVSNLAAANLGTVQAEQNYLNQLQNFAKINNAPNLADVGGDPFAYMEDLALADQGMGSQPVMGTPQALGTGSADQWIEPGFDDFPVDVAPRQIPITSSTINPMGMAVNPTGRGETEMIQERMADRQPGPLRTGISVGDESGSIISSPYTGSFSVDRIPANTSALLNFPSLASAADIQDVQRRGGDPSVNPRLTFENYNPYMMGAAAPTDTTMSGSAGGPASLFLGPMSQANPEVGAGMMGGQPLSYPMLTPSPEYGSAMEGMGAPPVGDPIDVVNVAGNIAKAGMRAAMPLGTAAMQLGKGVVSGMKSIGLPPYTIPTRPFYKEPQYPAPPLPLPQVGIDDFNRRANLFQQFVR